jgi:hypothetical protein
MLFVQWLFWVEFSYILIFAQAETKLNHTWGDEACHEKSV